MTDLDNKSIYEINMLENSLRHLDQQMNLVEQQILEYNTLEDGVNSLNKDPKSPAYFPLGIGFFVSGNLEKIDKLLVNVGAGVFIEKDIANALKLIEKRKGKLTEAKEKIAEQMRIVMESAAKLERDLQKKQ